MKKLLITLIFLQACNIYASECVEKEYYDSGELRFTNECVFGVNNGERLAYDKHGRITGRSNYIYGELEGEWIRYQFGFTDLGYINGEVVQRMFFKNGKRHGTYTEYKGGKPFYICQYHEGEMHGLSKRYDGDMLVNVSEYDNGYFLNSKSFDNKGNLIETITQSGKDVLLTVYNTDGSKHFDMKAKNDKAYIVHKYDKNKVTELTGDDMINFLKENKLIYYVR